MFLARVCGTVVADHKLPELEGASFRVVLPVDETGKPTGSHIVAVDNIASRDGDLVYLVKGKEAIIPWQKTDLAPIDAAIVGLVDGMEKA